MRPEEREQKENIQSYIQQFQTGDFLTNAENLFTVLGYASNYKAKLDQNQLCERGLNQEKALIPNWLNANLLFQVTGEDLSKQGSLFEVKFDIDRMQSYLFYAIELEPKTYPRGILAQITREVNKIFKPPVFILFKYGDYLTFAIIDRRQHKKEESRDVLEKVTLIKDIRIVDPHRAHIEILFDLSLEELRRIHKFSNFKELHAAWQKTLDTKELNKRFYREISAWYFYAKSQVLFPDDVEKDAEKRNSIALIRLITRLIFAWFIKEKGLVPEKLFDEDFLKEILNYSDKNGSTYYKAILQNLFFATLNLEMNKDKPDSRKFVQREDGFHSDQHLQPAYRYARFFKEPEQALALFENIPFLNGGLFENLDCETEEAGKRVIKRIDCFSDHPQNEEKLKVPDEIFFSELKKVDQCDVYGDIRHKSEEFRGIINIFRRYKFTIEENTPIEEEIALDPELLGKVFENLLAIYNPETHTTARKATGSFYTPREIVNYMVDESLVAYLETQLKEQISEFKDMETLGKLLRNTLSYTEEAHPFIKEEQVDALINVIDKCKILDPACGSGAFPMGILHKLVYLLHKLDPYNEKWKNRQIERVQSAVHEAEKVEDTAIREHLLHDLEMNIDSIEDAFLNNELDYGRKLYLIENCIYGVDIQPIAIQIAKLRFFISLVIDQKVDPAKPNLNIRALPNLETKFVAANTLIGLDKPAQIALRNHEIDRLEDELKDVRKNHFSARSRKEKIRLRKLDEQLRNQIARLLIADGWYDKSARQLADWNPYNQNTSSPFFDPEWMLGIADGFDIVIGNPPYVQLQKDGGKLADMYRNCQYVTFERTGDIYSLFYENGLKIVNTNGHLCFISSNKWMRTGYGKSLRKFFLFQNPKLLVDLGPGIFENAIVDTNILLIQKKENEKNLKAIALTKDDETSALSEFIMKNRVSLKNLTSDAWFIGGEAEQKLRKKIERIGRPLKEWDVKIYRGVLTGLNEAFIIDTEIRDRLVAEDPKSERILKPILQGRDIKRYGYEWAGLWIIFVPWHFPLHKDKSIQGASQKAELEFKKQYPAVYRHLQHFKNALSKRNKDETGIRYEWYALQRCAATYYPEFEKEKVVWKRIGSVLHFGHDTNFMFCQDSTCIMTGSNLKYLCAVMNSKIGYKQLYDLAPKTGTGDVIVSVQALEPLLIPPLIPENSQSVSKIVILVDQILASKRTDPQTDTTALEREIDWLVYQLYGLTEEEIAVVEGKS